MKRLYIIPEHDRIHESLELANQYQANFEYNDFFLTNVLDDERKIDELINFYLKQDHDISKDTMHGAFLDVTVHSEDRLIQEASKYRVKQSMEIAKKLGVHGVVFHTGRLAGFRMQSYLDHWLAENTAFFKEVLAEYPKQEIYMENMFDESSDMLVRLAENMKSEERFGVCLDYGHAILTQEPIECWIKNLAPYIKHLHINDNDKQNDLHLTVGEGHIDWKQMQEYMIQYKVDTSMLIEVNDIERQKKSIEYLKKRNIMIG